MTSAPRHTPSQQKQTDSTALRREAETVLRHHHLHAANKLARLAQFTGLFSLLFLIGLFGSWTVGSISSESTTFRIILAFGLLFICLSGLTAACSFIIARPYMETEEEVATEEQADEEAHSLHDKTARQTVKPQKKNTVPEKDLQGEKAGATGEKF